MAKQPEPRQQAEQDAPDFERALRELEELVERMEQGDITLEESLRCFERGIALTRRCQQALQAAEQKVQILIEESGRNEIQPFESEPED